MNTHVRHHDIPEVGSAGWRVLTGNFPPDAGTSVGRFESSTCKLYIFAVHSLMLWLIERLQTGWSRYLNNTLLLP